ncbi:MAG TPA: hypothetical protein VF791_14070 [Pyrinomonadaceae bacterium]
MTTPTIIAVSGFSSGSGKTTVLCDLLRAFPGWEAIKITRGHYRSCGKDPEACCVSHLLSAEPVIRSGRAQTYAPGKDTGRYWDAGAANVHWLIVTTEQVERGIKLALNRVQGAGVFVEGTSFLKYLDTDFALMVTRSGGGKIKPSARQVLAKTQALYLFDDVGDDNPNTLARFKESSFADSGSVSALPIYTSRDLPKIIARIQAVHSAAPA